MESGRNLDKNTLLPNTLSMLGDFCQTEAVLGRGTSSETRKENPLAVDEQISLIYNIFMSCHSVRMDNKRELLLDLKNGEVQNVERNIKNFSVIMKMAFRNIEDDEGFECIDLPKLLEVVKSKPTLSYRISRSIFHRENRLNVDLEKGEMISEQKITHNFMIDSIPKEQYQEIVEGINAHWQGLIPTILDHLTAGKYVSDKKNLWLLLMFNSNHGKTKLFKWMEVFGGAGFVNFEDIVSSGISDKSPDEFEGKMCLVVDEVKSFSRKLFEIEDTLTVRPMRSHSIKIPINSRILLSADGGVFNNDYMDSQIINRVAVVDLRSEESVDLGNLPIVQKYGKYSIGLVMSHWLYTELKSRLEVYHKLDHIGRANFADEVINRIFKKYKQKKADLFDTIEKSLGEILQNPRRALDDRTYSMLMDAIVIANNSKLNGWIVRRPKDVIEKILINYDKSMKEVLVDKTIKQMTIKINGFREGRFKIDGDLIRGLYIPRIENAEEIVARLAKEGNISYF